jgi:cbb3-type cytochrome oxidase cytochrome c subunit
MVKRMMMTSPFNHKENCQCDMCLARKLNDMSKEQQILAELEALVKYLQHLIEELKK